MPARRGIKRRRQSKYDYLVKRPNELGPVSSKAVYMDIAPTVRMSSRAANVRTGGFMGIENKFYDSTLDQAALTSPTDASGGEKNPSATISLNTVVQGDGESNRDGRQISMNKISVVGNFKVAPQANQTASSEPTICYCALILDTQTNGALLNSEDVFKNVGGTANLAAQPYRNLQFTKRFRVLASIRRVFDAPAYATYDGTNIEQGGMTQTFEMHVPLKVLTQYSNTTETIANIVDNGLNIVAWCSSTELAPKLSYAARLRFTG